MYACPNIATQGQRRPRRPQHAGLHARAARDALHVRARDARWTSSPYALGMDPIELRRINDTADRPDQRHAVLQPLADEVLRRRRPSAFGWSRRDPQPGLDARRRLAGRLGLRHRRYPSQHRPGRRARVADAATGKARVEIAGARDRHRRLHRRRPSPPPTRSACRSSDVTVELGDSDLPPAPVAGGSNNAATTSHVVAKACEEIRDRLAAAAVAGQRRPLRRRDPGDAEACATARSSARTARASRWRGARPRRRRRARGLCRERARRAAARARSPSSTRASRRCRAARAARTSTAYAFGAQFVEVRVHRLHPRDPRRRAWSAPSPPGTIVNPLTAHSQFMGGVIWGVSLRRCTRRPRSTSAPRATSTTTSPTT